MGTEKPVEHESDVSTNYNWSSWYSHQMINKKTGRLGNKRTSRDHPNYCIVEIGQNSKKSPGALRWLVTQTPVRDYQLTQVWKTLKGEIIIMILIIIINHRISECSNLAQKEHETRHDLVGKVIHWELYKKWKFDHTNKWYMHNPASNFENETETPLGF